MTTLALSSLGGRIGENLLGNKFGQLLGSEIGSYIGGQLDSNIFGLSQATSIKEHGKIEELTIQTATYGKMIPIIYGTTRIAGNIIWALPIKEEENVEKLPTSLLEDYGPYKEIRNYKYYVTLAIGICEGEIDDVTRIWANNRLLDKNKITFRLYKGTETQEPDPLINATLKNTVQKFEKTNGATTDDTVYSPAYRGLAYIVIENFPITEYRNRIPNFTFEVKRVNSIQNNKQTLEQKIKGINIIPGSGEFVYDTEIETQTKGSTISNKWIQSGQGETINQNSYEGEADAIVSLNNLQSSLPNIQWVSVVISWFCDSLDASSCNIYPAVETNVGIFTQPNLWHVGKFSRRTARQISLDSDGRPNYGGTISDNAIIAYINELKSRGYNVMLYPILQVDTIDKPWRGKITGDANSINSFFSKYNRFIKHYANLCATQIDAFIIGSELKGITSIETANHNFPAIQKLISLANTIRSIVDINAEKHTIITYAADWSEYHSTNGYFHMDDLWSSANIDVVGIDAYFPLTDEYQPIQGFSVNDIKNGWTSGEGYEYYYSNPQNNTGKTAFSSNLYAWKNIEYWWRNEHRNPNSPTKTSWIQASKPIWFTEFGFASIDACSNQPNVFIDQTSIESSYPKYSNHNIDFQAQRNAIEGTIDKWSQSNMVQNMFLWTWDARPFPYFPDRLDIWSDGNAWVTGHWVQGKLSVSTLDNIVQNLLSRIGYSNSQIDTANLTQIVYGFSIVTKQTINNTIAILQQAYFFDIIESDNKVRFITRGNNDFVNIQSDDLIDKKAFEISCASHRSLLQQLHIVYIDRFRNYKLDTQHALSNDNTNTLEKIITLPLVLEENNAKGIAEMTLIELTNNRYTYKINLPIKYIYLEPSDIIQITANDIIYKIRILKTIYGNGIIIYGTSYDDTIYNPNTRNQSYNYNITDENTYNEYIMLKTVILDIPLLSITNNENIVYFSIVSLTNKWYGAEVYMSTDNGQNYDFITRTNVQSTCGYAVNELGSDTINEIDSINSLTVSLIYGELENLNNVSLLNYNNMAKIGNEIIQFKNVEYIENNRYILSNLLRGRFGTTDHVSNHKIGEDFTLINGQLLPVIQQPSALGIKRYYKVVPIGEDINDISEISFIYKNDTIEQYSAENITITKLTNGHFIIKWSKNINAISTININLIQYKVNILDNNNDSIREILVNSRKSYRYSKEEQIEDFGTKQNSINVVVIQLSNT